MIKQTLPFRMLAAAAILSISAHASAAGQSGNSAGICSFIDKEVAQLSAAVEGRNGAAPDKFVGKGGKGLAYRHEGEAGKIEYTVTPDGRPYVISAVLEREHLARRGITEETLANDLRLTRPFPARLELTCQTRVLYIASAQGRVESMQLSARP